MELKNPTTLQDIAREMKINKSTLHYYTIKGLIAPVGTVGRTFVFEKDETVKRIKEIQRLKKSKGLTLREIEEKFAPLGLLDN